MIERRDRGLGLEAELLELATEGERHWASVRFSGSVREWGARRCAGALRRSVEPREARGRLERVAPGRHPANALMTSDLERV